MNNVSVEIYQIGDRWACDVFFDSISGHSDLIEEGKSESDAVADAFCDLIEKLDKRTANHLLSIARLRARVASLTRRGSTMNTADGGEGEDS